MAGSCCQLLAKEVKRRGDVTRAQGHSEELEPWWICLEKLVLQRIHSPCHRSQVHGIERGNALYLLPPCYLKISCQCLPLANPIGSQLPWKPRKFSHTGEAPLTIEQSRERTWNPSECKGERTSNRINNNYLLLSIGCLWTLQKGQLVPRPIVEIIQATSLVR